MSIDLDEIDSLLLDLEELKYGRSYEEGKKGGKDPSRKVGDCHWVLPSQEPVKEVETGKGRLDEMNELLEEMDKSLSNPPTKPCPSIPRPLQKTAGSPFPSVQLPDVGGRERCKVLQVGGVKAEMGAYPRVCDNMRCVGELARELRKNTTKVKSNRRKWNDKVTSMDFRNYWRDWKKLEELSTPSTGSRLYWCQCCWLEVGGERGKVPVKDFTGRWNWKCGGHG